MKNQKSIHKEKMGSPFLFLNSDNEGQFSSVLAHELAHLSQRHFARNVLKSQESNLASALIMVSSIAIALISNNPNAMAVGPAILQSQSLRYSRLFEKEADRVGLLILSMLAITQILWAKCLKI